jgi:hypothetical protein
MKLRIIKLSVALSALALVVVSLMSCDEDESVSSKVELLSFGPSGVRHGDDIFFIGNNLTKVTSIELPGITVEKSQFKSHTSEQIVLTVPETAEEGLVTLKTTEGDIITKTALSFEVEISIGPLPAEAKPGTELTLTGEFMNWVEEVWFSDGVLVTDFVSASVNELVLVVPMEAKTGTIVLIGGGTDPVEIESAGELTITLPNVASMSPNPVGRGETLTITGEDLDLVDKVQFKGNAEVTEFTSSTPTQLVLTVPEEANQGKITLVTFSGETVESDEILGIVGALPPLEAISPAIYIDGLQAGWQKWGWGSGTVALESTENVREGEKSIKYTTGGDWGAPLHFGGTSISTTGKTEFALSIFGGPGTGGKVINLVVKDGTTETEKQLTITEGEWVEFKIPLSQLGSYSQIVEMFMQDRGWAGTIYVDHIGLR